MECLPKDVLATFLKGEHVMRHQSGLWNGIWSDMFIETTFMRYGHGPGGLIGITLKPSALKRWALSLHICSHLIKDLVEMKDVNKQSHQVNHHKEEMSARKKSDAKDRENIREKLQSCIDPLDPDDHPTDIINIVSGQIAPESVNVDNSVSIGEKQMKIYEANWPESFYSSIAKQVVTMAEKKRRTRIGSNATYDTSLIFTRVMCLMASRDVDVKDVFRHELAPIPTSLFTDSGDMRLTKTKSILKRKLQVEKSGRTLQKPDAVVIDGCAILWIIHWPSHGTVQDFVDGFLMYILEKLSCSDIYLVFDRYHDYSIKSGTRSCRAGSQASRRHKLGLNTLLPSQNIILNVSESKVQLIDMICEQLLLRVKLLQVSNSTSYHRLVVTASQDIPKDVYMGTIIQRCDLKTSHEEADVIIPQQVVHIAAQGIRCISVVCDDTDVFLLLLHYYHQKKLSCYLLMEGTTSQRTTTDIAATVKKHANIVPQLLAAHALSGCDTVAYMYGIGKGTVVNMLLKGHTLDKLGDSEAQMNDIVEESTKFAAACYGIKAKGTMSEIRYDVWTTRTGRRKVTTTPKLNALPPTTEAFEENVKRAHLQTCIWKAACDEDPPDMDPTRFGWSKDYRNKLLIPITVPSGVQPAPPEILQMIRCGDQMCSTGRCRCASAQLACTIFCDCYKSEECQNRWTKAVTEHDDEDDDDDKVDDWDEPVNQ